MDSIQEIKAFLPRFSSQYRSLVKKGKILSDSTNENSFLQVELENLLCFPPDVLFIVAVVFGSLGEMVLANVPWSPIEQGYSNGYLKSVRQRQ